MLLPVRLCILKVLLVSRLHANYAGNFLGNPPISSNDIPEQEKRQGTRHRSRSYISRVALMVVVKLPQL